MNSTIGIVVGSLVGIGLVYAGTRTLFQSKEPQPPKYAYTSESAGENYTYPAEPDDVTHVGGRKKRNKKNTKRKKIK